jgi:hypothetical protein
MPQFTGLDLCTSFVGVQRLETNEDSLVALEAPQASPSIQPIFPVLNDRLRLDENTLTISRRWAEDAWIREPLRERVAKFARVTGDLNQFKLGVAIPYSASPPFRRSLPELLGFDKTKQAKNHYFAVEAVVAAGLSLLAAKQVQLPAEVLFCLEVAPSVELSVVEISAQENLLEFKVLASGERNWLHPPDDPATELAEFQQVFGWHPSSHLTVWSTTAAAATGQRIADALGVSNEPHVLDAMVLADGAARFSAYGNQFGGHAIQRTVQEIRIDRICSRPLGVVGHNGQGQWFWRRLFQAGTRLPVQTQIAVNQVINPPVLVLAECGDSVATSPLWLSQTDWPTHRLRVFSSAAVENLHAAPTELEIALENPSGPQLWNAKVLHAECR